MTTSNDRHHTQHLANAAETFVRALGALFPDETFDQFFHGDTLYRAYWVALHQALDQYVTEHNEALVRGLMAGQVLADRQVVEELLRLFLPDQAPDYAAVADHCADVLRLKARAIPRLAREIEALFITLAAELRRSADFQRVLHHLAQVHPLPLGVVEDELSTQEQDLRRVLDTALVTGPSTLTLQVRHLLALAGWDDATGPDNQPALVALTRLAAYLSEDDLAAVWERVDHLDDPAQRVTLLGRLAPHLSRQGLVADPLALVQSALLPGGDELNPAVQVGVLLDLAPQLATPERTRAVPFRQRVLSGIRAITDPASRVRALGAVIEYSRPEHQTDAVTWAFESAAEIRHDMARAMALSSLPASLPPEFHLRLLDLADTIDAPDARALLLGRMIPHLAADLQSDALAGALAAIEQLPSDEARTSALIQLAPHIDAMGPLHHLPEGLHDTLAVTFSIASADERARAFAMLAPYLAPELLTEALHVLRDITDAHQRSAVLTRLAPHLPDDLQVAAYALAQEIEGGEARARALVAIAPYLSLNARLQSLADALAAALGVEDRYERIMALVDLAPHLPDDLQWRALQEALTASRSLRNETERSRALVFLAPHLVPDQMADAVADAYTILEPLERVPALSALLPYLPDEPRRRVGQDVIKLAGAVKPAHHKAGILASIAPVLPEDLIDDAVRVAGYIQTPYDQMHVFTALLPRQPDRLHAAALGVARSVPNRYQRANALLDLVPHTPPGARYELLDEALDEALGVPDDYDRASALAQLALYIDAQADVQDHQYDALSLALDVCLATGDPAARAALLGRLAAVWCRLLPPAQSYTLWRRIVTFLQMRPYADVLTDLAALAPVLDLMGAPGSMQAVADALVAGVE